MVRVVAGYTIEQDDLVRFLDAQGWGPEPGCHEFSVDNAWINFQSWRKEQPQNDTNPKTLVPRPQCASRFPPLPMHANIPCPTQTGTIAMKITYMPS